MNGKVEVQGKQGRAQRSHEDEKKPSFREQESPLSLPASELYEKLLYAQRLPPEFSNKKDHAVQQKAVELVTFAILEHGKFSASDKMSLRKASTMGLINLLADDFSEAIVRNRAGNVFFDELCRAYGAQATKDKDYSDYYERFNDAQKDASLHVARSMRGPGYYVSGSGSTMVATKIERPRDKNAELAALIAEKPILGIGSQDPVYLSMTRRAREALGAYLDIKPQSVDPKFVTDLVEFIIGFGELQEVKKLREKMQTDPSLPRMMQTAGYEEWLGLLLVGSAAGVFPWGKAFRGTGVGEFTRALFSAAKESDFVASTILRFSRKEEANLAENAIKNASKNVTKKDVAYFIKNARGGLNPAKGFVNPHIGAEKQGVLAELRTTLTKSAYGDAHLKILRTYGVRLRNNLAELVQLAKPGNVAAEVLGEILQYDPKSLGSFAASFAKKDWEKISQLAAWSPKEFTPALYLIKDKNKYAEAVLKGLLVDQKGAGMVVFGNVLDGKISLMEAQAAFLFEKSKFFYPLRTLAPQERYEIIEKLVAESAEKKAASTTAEFALWKRETLGKLDRLAVLETRNPGVTKSLYNERKADLLSDPSLLPESLN